MKKLSYLKSGIILLASIIALPLPVEAKKKKVPEPPYKFTILVEHPRTAIKNQGSSSTCWCYSTSSFLESEMQRIGKPMVELSVMYTVRNTYIDKAEEFIRWNGKCEFGPGGADHDVINSIKKYGIVPMAAYPGNEIKEQGVIHNEMDGVLRAYVDAIGKNPNGKLSTAWKNGFTNLVDAYLGEVPEDFEYAGTSYTPTTFAASLGLNMDDYVQISSFTHHPFYEKFVLEVPDNFARGTAYNVPIDELDQIVENSLKTGYTVAWATDLESGFNFGLGVAVVPPIGWDGKTFKPGMEPEITQERRQVEFENYQTTDDHGMHLVGIAHDQNGGKYYCEKNSWGPGNQYKGYSYISSAYLKLKSTCIMVNKNGIPAEVRKKLGI
jgi:bleomycin hydrolase